ncbi:hypothetical protein AB8Q64_19770 [Klebsiella pneumoniae subsp. ozaenae]
MKKPFLILLLVASQSVFADKIPTSIENLIAANDTRTHSLENGELIVRYGRSEVTLTMVESMLNDICGDYFMNKWKPATIKKITLLNITRDQGYKLNAGGEECQKTGAMTYEQDKAYKASIIESAKKLE